jgi:hypothetical protein
MGSVCIRPFCSPLGDRDSSVPQSQWRTNNTMDPDSNPEPLAMPSENWVPLPWITAVTNTPGGFQLSFPAVPGYDYTAQYSSFLNLPDQWTNLSTTAGTGSVTTVTLTDPSAPTDKRFYRLARQPSP